MAILGIDLGTTNSLMSIFDDSGIAKIVHNKEGRNLTPSVAWIQDKDKKSIKVGDEAKNVIGQEHNVYFEFKREMGKSTRYPFFDVDISATELSAFVLQKLKKDFEAMHGDVETVVITVPANFANEQREATLAAAKIAGFKTQLLINEPTAAALHYAYSDSEDDNGTYMVFDFGGGTFDVSIVKVNGSNVEVVGSDGLQKCGGADLDKAVLKVISMKFNEECNAELDLSKSNFSISNAEEIKISLSSLNEKKVSIISEGYPKKTFTITRNEFEAEIGGILTQMRMVCENILVDCNLDTSQIKEIFLAGGSSRIPCVQSMLEDFFGRKPKLKGNPDEAISLGAALYAGIKSDKSKLKTPQKDLVAKLSLQEVSPAYFGMISLNDSKLVNSVLIKKNEKIPCSVTESFYTVTDDQDSVNLRITQSPVDENDPRFVRTIWEGSLSVPKGRPAGQEVKVTYAYQENGLMSATFIDISSGQQQAVDITAQSEGAKSDININDFIVD
ncbi:MAG: Hsp70 family protein [Methylophilaceae bacterium]|nr:Hsp70 family protein [Methylophilaceae bacterium]